MAAKLLVTRLHALLDAVIALFAGARDLRTGVIDPGAFAQGVAVWWGLSDEFTAASAAGVGGVVVYTLPHNEGDRLHNFDLRLKQAGATAITATLYALAAGARTTIASATSSASLFDFQPITLAAGSYVVPADTAIALELVAGSVGDQFGGANYQWDHPV